MDPHAGGAELAKHGSADTLLLVNVGVYDGKPSFNMTTLCIKHARDLD